MGDKIRKTLSNLFYGTAIGLMSFLPMNKVNAQSKMMHNHTMKEADKEMMRVQRIDKESPNILYLVFQPGDLGFGLRYDRRITNFGAYTSLSKGNYKLAGGDYINDHVKFALGGLFYPKKNFDESQAFFSGGITYNKYGERSYEFGTINEKVFEPFSIEAGVGVKIGTERGREKRHFTGSIRFDPFKWEGSMDFGWAF